MPAGMGGVTQPGGAGTTIYVYDNGHADAGGKGYYNLADILARVGGVGGPAVGDFGSTGTVPDEYWSVVNISFSDNIGFTGGIKTTWQEQRSTLKFDAAGVGLITPTSPTAAADVTFRLGSKVGTSSRAATWEGIKLCNRRSTTWRGTFFIYGSVLTTDTSNFIIFPYAASTPSEMLGSRVEAWASTGTVGVGVTGFDWAVLYNNTLLSGNAIVPVNNLFAIDAEELIIATTTLPQYLLSTGSQIRAKNMSFKGSPTAGELRNTGVSTWTLVNPRFADTAPRVFAATQPIEQWWDFNVYVVDASGNPVSGVPVSVWDNTFTLVVGTYTNSDGLLDYNSGLTKNAIKVTEWIGGLVPPDTLIETKWWPFLVRVGGGKPFSFTFPHTTGTYGELYLPHVLVYNIATNQHFFTLAPEVVRGL